MSGDSARKRIFAELWVSFAALVRSYAAAHNLGRPAAGHAKVDEEKPARLSVQCGRRTLEIDFDEAAGMGRWTLMEQDGGLTHEAAQGAFEISEDSRVALSDRAEKLELEVAAESFTARVFDEE